jgi:Photosynthetic reaction centre cytochrome C subunit
MRSSVQKWVLASALVVALAAVIGATMLRTGSAYAGGDMPKNVKSAILKGKTKDDVKKYMKERITKALGVQCDFCHNLDDMAADTDHKKRAFQMLEMVAGINKKYMAGKELVGCMTCHRGKQKPDAK